MRNGHAIVFDVGKTFSKISLWSNDGRMLDRRVRPNDRVSVDDIRRLDVDGIRSWLVDTLGDFAEYPIEYVIPVAHGAGVAALDGDSLAFAPLDYEQDLPADLHQQYLIARSPFARTGSPALPHGLNIGAQLFWLDRLYSNRMAKATLLPWAQYWTWFLSGKAHSEFTSLGCHSDLWEPRSGRFSDLAKLHGWADRFAPLARAGDVVGTLKTDLAEHTGLSREVKILTGLHDSNAAFLAAKGFREVEGNEATILSTGTWFVAMRSPKGSLDFDALDERRDCLVNVDVDGAPVPSARFMGGREIETLIEIDTRRVDIKPDQPKLLSAVREVLENDAFVSPTLARGNGPFPDSEGGWIGKPKCWYARRAGACLYAALVMDVALDLIGSKDRLLIEGRFAEAEVFVRGLASLRPNTEVFVANAHNDVGLGALRLLYPSLKPAGKLERVEPLEEDIAAYRRKWRAASRNRS